MRERPISVLIFGILNIVLALIDFVGVVVGQALQHASPSAKAVLEAVNSNPTFVTWTHIQTVYTVMVGLALVAAGVGLLLLQNWARILSLVYAGIDIVMTLVAAYFSQLAMHAAAQVTLSHSRTPISPEMMDAFLLIGLVFGTVFRLAYPVLLLIFMTRPKVCRAFEPQPASTPAPSNPA